MASSGERRERGGVQVALFVTCLIDLFRPSAAFAAVRLLEEAGCSVVVPPSQTCCGQPAYNSGDRDTAREIAKLTIAAFETYPHVVVPSGSCAGMLEQALSRVVRPGKRAILARKGDRFCEPRQGIDGVSRR